MGHPARERLSFSGFPLFHRYIRRHPLCMQYKFTGSCVVHLICLMYNC